MRWVSERLTSDHDSVEAQLNSDALQVAALFVSEPTECSELRRELLRLQADKNEMVRAIDKQVLADLAV